MSSRNGPTCRQGPPPGGSILATSAPRSPRSLPQNWPVSFASSRILRPASGPGRGGGTGPWGTGPWGTGPWGIGPWGIGPWGIGPWGIGPWGIGTWAIGPWAIAYR